jgi:alpha/beta superfamily hydrolase
MFAIISSAASSGSDLCSESGPAAQVAELYDSLAEPKQIHWVEGADHFFAGKLDEVQQVLQEFLPPLVGQAA